MKYRNTVRCKCSAIVGIGTRWVTGWYEEGTADVFHSTSLLPAGHCPICRRKLEYGLWFWS